jgi:hypothetical protein
MIARPTTPMRPLTVLSIACPLAPVGPDAVGGAGQVLGVLDREPVRRARHAVDDLAATVVTPPSKRRRFPPDAVVERYLAAYRRPAETRHARRADATPA